MGVLAQRALGPESRRADFEGGLVMAFLPTGGSNSTAALPPPPNTSHLAQLFTHLFIQSTNIY